MTNNSSILLTLPKNIQKGLDNYINAVIEEDKSLLPKTLRVFDKVILEPLQEIFQNSPPEKWGIKITRLLINYKKRLETIPNDDKDFEIHNKINYFLSIYLPVIWDELYHKPKDSKLPVVRMAIDRVLSIKLRLPLPEFEPQDIRVIPLERILRTIPKAELYDFRFEKNEAEKDNTFKILLIKDVFGHDLRLPLTSDVYYKGGWARLIFKLYFYHHYQLTGESQKIIELIEELLLAELPMGDCDIMTTNLLKGKKIMEIVGEKDLTGIELFHDLDYAFGSRDLTINLVLFTLLGIIYSPLAEEAIRTGITYHLPADHGIYSKNFFIYQGHQFIQDRGFEREFKFVIDNKIKGFTKKKENLQIFMGRYSLVGIGRFIEKPDAAERLEKFYYLLEQTGQLEMYRYVFLKKLKRNFSTITEFYELLHCLYPDFSIIRSNDDYFRAQWYGKKLIRWFRRDFKKIFRIKSDFSWIELDEKEEKITFTLKNFKSNLETVKKLKEFIPGYIKRCQKRFQYSS